MQRSKLTKTVGANAGKRRKMALGKGLGALIPEVDKGKEAPQDYFLCDIELIRPNRFQPRLNFSEVELQDLTDSIKSQGILQPLLVRKDEDGYELIAGERRLRAARRARFGGRCRIHDFISRILSNSRPGSPARPAAIRGT